MKKAKPVGETAAARRKCTFGAGAKPVGQFTRRACDDVPKFLTKLQAAYAATRTNALQFD